MSLKFGTDGWRAIIADEFTFANVRRLTAAIEQAMRESGAGSAADHAVVVGHDTRFQSAAFARAVTETLLAAGRRVRLTDSFCPTPSASVQVVETGAPFAVVVTASHNPALFNGIKIKDATGSSASQEITAACEKRIPPGIPNSMDCAEGTRRGNLEIVSFRPAHEERLSRMVDIEAIRSAGFRIAMDPMFGACGRLLETMLQGGRSAVTTIHTAPDPLFGGLHPEPVEQHLDELKRVVVSEDMDAGFATDGDGDRIGAFDEKGQFVSPLRIAPLLAWNLIKKGRKGPLGKTFANTLLLDRIARHYGLPFSTFPVGFKFIASEMRAGRMLLGGEESGGIGVEGYIPERDGTLVSLLMLQAMVDEGKPLSEMVSDLTRAFGELHYRRRDLACTPEKGARIVKSLESAPPKTIGGFAVTAIDDLDGLKLLFGDDGWILFRASGTEPVLRVYSETPSRNSLDKVMAEALSMVERS